MCKENSGKDKNVSVYEVVYAAVIIILMFGPLLGRSINVDNFFFNYVFQGYLILVYYLLLLCFILLLGLLVDILTKKKKST